MKRQDEIQEMLDYIIGLQKEAEHKLAEHVLTPYARRSLERTMVDASRDAQVLEWVLSGEEAVAV